MDNSDDKTRIFTCRSRLRPLPPLVHGDPSLGQHAQAELYGYSTEPHVDTEGNGAFKPAVLVDTRTRIVDTTFTRGRLQVVFWRYHPFRRFGDLESKWR